MAHPSSPSIVKYLLLLQSFIGVNTNIYIILPYSETQYYEYLFNISYMILATALCVLGLKVPRNNFVNVLRNIKTPHVVEIL